MAPRARSASGREVRGGFEDGGVRLEGGVVAVGGGGDGGAIGVEDIAGFRVECGGGGDDDAGGGEDEGDDEAKGKVEDGEAALAAAPFPAEHGVGE